MTPTQLHVGKFGNSFQVAWDYLWISHVKDNFNLWFLKRQSDWVDWKRIPWSQFQCETLYAKVWWTRLVWPLGRIHVKFSKFSLSVSLNVVIVLIKNVHDTNSTDSPRLQLLCRRSYVRLGQRPLFSMLATRRPEWKKQIKWIKWISTPQHVTESRLSSMSQCVLFDSSQVCQATPWFTLGGDVHEGVVSDQSRVPHKSSKWKGNGWTGVPG